MLPIKDIVYPDLHGFSSFCIDERGSLSQWQASLPLEGKVPLQKDYMKTPLLFERYRGARHISKSKSKTTVLRKKKGGYENKIESW